MLVGWVLGVLFVSLIRRVMVEDPELPFPESVAASRDPQGRAERRARRRSICSTTSAIGAVVFLRRRNSTCSRPTKNFFFPVGQLGESTLRLGAARIARRC